MIQRIQSVYLLLVTILLVVAICMPVGQFIGADGVTAHVSNLWEWLWPTEDFSLLGACSGYCCSVHLLPSVRYSFSVTVCCKYA